MVSCPAICHFGIELGGGPWYQAANIKGGEVSGNKVSGALIQINAQGAGTAEFPLLLINNVVGPSPASGSFRCGNVAGLSPINVAPYSFVDSRGAMPTGSISVPGGCT